MRTVQKFLQIIGTLALIAFGFYAWTQWDAKQQDAQPAAPQAIVITATPELATIVPLPIPWTPTPTAEPAAVEAVFTLTTGEWVNDVNAQFLTDCAYNIAKGLVHDPACPVDAAALLGVGR